MIGGWIYYGRFIWNIAFRAIKTTETFGVYGSDSLILVIWIMDYALCFVILVGEKEKHINASVIVVDGIWNFCGGNVDGKRM